MTKPFFSPPPCGEGNGRPSWVGVDESGNSVPKSPDPPPRPSPTRGEGAELWTVDAIAAATRGERAGQLPQVVTGISIDSRTVAAGQAFFAIKGDTHDGHDF